MKQRRARGHSVPRSSVIRAAQPKYSVQHLLDIGHTDHAIVIQIVHRWNHTKRLVYDGPHIYDTRCLVAADGVGVHGHVAGTSGRRPGCWGYSLRPKGLAPLTGAAGLAL